MGMHTITVTAGEGAFRLEASVTVMPRGITVTACSPDYAHLGATAQAIPRPEAGRTATVSLLSVPCHRDEIPAHDIAAELATRFRVPVAASTGFHVDAATDDDIKAFLAATRELVERIAERVGPIRRAAWEDEEDVVAVDPSGEVIGRVPRTAAHDGEGILHQAFLTLLVGGSGDDAHLLLCRRSTLKPLWGGVLADACAGHTRPGETVERSAARRLEEELGVRLPEGSLELAGHVTYREDHGDGRCEHEWCAVLIARLPEGQTLCACPEEVDGVRFVPLDELDGYLADKPEPLAPWLRLALLDGAVRDRLADQGR